MHMASRVHLVLDPGEHDAFRARATEEGTSLSEWLREAARERLARSRPSRIGTVADLDRFFEERTAAEPGAEPGWDEHLMVIELPGGRSVRLGQELRAEFPPHLEQLDNPELITLLGRIDPTPNSVSGSGTRDWADLADRIHFIADLFRCFHRDTTLMVAPFTSEQVAEMKVGRRPAGRL